MEPTHEHEITAPVLLCTPDGQRLDPRARGWSRHPLHTANLRGNRLRTKKWDYWALLSDDVAVGIVYADVGYLGMVSIWWGDLRTGTTGGRDVAVPFSKGISLPDVPGTGVLRYESSRLSLCIDDRDPSATAISATWTEEGDTPASLDARVLHPDGHESLSVVIPWSDRRFQFTTKDQARPVVGTLQIAEREYTLGAHDPGDGGDGSAWGVLDVGRGRWPYSTTWNWGGGAGHAESGEVVGLQFGARWTEGTGFTENAVTVDGRLHKIGRELIWTYDWDDPMSPWRVSDPGGAVDLVLTPRLDRHSRTEALVLRTEVHQVFGTWTGIVRTVDGDDYHLDGALGFAEESRSRW